MATSTVIQTAKYSTLTDETDARGFTCFYLRDRRGYWLKDFRYGGFGWPTREAALTQAIYFLV